jgi:hypothetical protein
MALREAPKAVLKRAPAGLDSATTARDAMEAMMDAHRTIRACLAIAGAILLPPYAAHAQESAGTAAANASSGSLHDFDFELGTWKTHVSRLAHPLSGSREWVELDGTSVVRNIMDGSANLVELDIAGPSGRIAGVSLRLYNPDTRQWSLNYANFRSGTLSAPVTGRIANGRGEFFGSDAIDGKPVFVRFVIACASADTCRFEQAFSPDGGKSWEVNWIATDTRTAGREAKP